MSPQHQTIFAELQSKGYLFHGSTDAHDTLKPRQAYSTVSGVRVPDDKPGVHTTPDYRIAIFMAIFNDRYIKGVHCGFSVTTAGVDLHASRDSFEQARGSKGFVHVMKPDGFIERNSSEYISYSAVGVAMVIEVDFTDLVDVRIV
jgi:hypothetical protein